MAEFGLNGGCSESVVDITEFNGRASSSNGGDDDANNHCNNMNNFSEENSYTEEENETKHDITVLNNEHGSNWNGKCFFI